MTVFTDQQSRQCVRGKLGEHENRGILFTIILPSVKKARPFIQLKRSSFFWSRHHDKNEDNQDDEDDDKSGDKVAFVNVIEINKGGWVSISPTLIP